MKLLEDLSNEELNKVSRLIGEAFVSNDLFYEFGSIEERKDIIMKYMLAYVECVYKSKSLYKNDEGTAYIGLSFSDKKAVLPQIKMMFKIIKIVPLKLIIRFLNHIKQIKDGNKEYTKNTYLEVLMVCVPELYQGRGKMRELVEFAMNMAKERNVPLLIDTDMEEYAKMYQHFGCELYNTKTASNGVTRYNLVWKPSE
jgi:hypothetical protein